MAEEKKEKSLFDRLFEVNVNGHTDKIKNQKGKEFTYLTWSWAWAEFKKRCPGATYQIKCNPETNQHFWYDKNLGYEVRTSVTVGDMTHEMWLPVLDSANNAMKAEPYTVKTKYSTRPVAAATMFDINTAIMRCLTKNLAMFGLGLYIYSGEDLPEVDSDDADNSTQGSTAKAGAKPQKGSEGRKTAPAQSKSAAQAKTAERPAQPQRTTSQQTPQQPQAGKPVPATQAQLKMISELCTARSETKKGDYKEDEIYAAFKTRKDICSMERAYMIINWFKKTYPDLDPEVAA